MLGVFHYLRLLLSGGYLALGTLASSLTCPCPRTPNYQLKLGAFCFFFTTTRDLNSNLQFTHHVSYSPRMVFSHKSQILMIFLVNNVKM